MYARRFELGLTARLVLGLYEASLGVTLNSIDDSAFAQKMSPFDYSTTRKRVNNAGSFDAYVLGCQLFSLEHGYDWHALVEGWNFGDDLVKNRDVNPKPWKAAWKLLRYRHSIRELGEVTGYALSYMTGRLRVAAILSATGAQPVASQSDMDILVDKFEDNSPSRDSEKLGISFGRCLARVAIAADPTHREVHRFFLEGYLAGCAKGETQIFKDTLRLGFTLGYKSGYDQGYADAYRAGYVNGERDALASAGRMFQSASSSAQAKDVEGWVKTAKDIVEIASVILGG